MANYYATARSNYFAVKDETAFREWAGLLGLTILEPDRHDKVADGIRRFGISSGNSDDSGGWPTSMADEETGDYLNRYAGLLALLDPAYLALRPVSTVVEPTDKQKMFETFRQNNREGVVFKDVDAPFSPGRPASGGTQLKFKFVESASFVVTARNAKRSVSLGLYDTGMAASMSARPNDR